MYTVARLARQPLLIVALATTACGFDSSYDGAQLRCSAAAPTCPDGFVCFQDRCTQTVPPRVDAHGPDATTCELAAQAADNDRCADAIALDLIVGREVFGDTTGYGNDLAPSTLPGCTGSPEPGPDAVYAVTVAAGDVVHATLRTTGHDGAVYVLDGCSLTAACLGGADALGAGALDVATVPIATTGTYYLVVDASLTGAAGCYALQVELTHP